MSFTHADITRRDMLSAAGAAAIALNLSLRPSRGEAPAKDVPWLDEIQRHGQLPDDAPMLSNLLVDADGEAITSLPAWKKQRDTIRKRWTDYVQPLPPNRAAPKLAVIEEDRPEGAIRQLVTYEGEPGITVRGYLLRPAMIDDNAKLPGAVVMHSTVDHTIRQPAGLDGPPEKWFGLGLAKRGCVAFCPECFLWHDKGELSYAQVVERFHQRHPNSKGMAKMLFDAMRAVDVLASVPYVDAKHIGAVGHSLGAKEALYLAAFDERVKVTVSSEGGIGTTFSNWDAVWYLDKAIKEFAKEHEHHELLALCAPRPFLLLGGDSADGERSWPFIDAALPVYELYGKPARLGLFNHKKGHAVPPQAEKRIYEWLLTHL